MVRRAHESFGLELRWLAAGVNARPQELIAKPFWRQPSRPPASGRTRLIPRRLSSSATLALVASLGHVQ